MISYRDYGSRMIGATAAASRADLVRRRYMGASAPSFGPLTYTAPVQVTGEGQVTRTPPAPAPVVKHLALSLGPSAPPAAPTPLPAAVPSTTSVPLHLAPVVAAGPVTLDTYVPPLVTVSATPEDCPECPGCAGKMIATGIGAALLMLGVGVATNMVKFKSMGRKKNGRRRR